MKLFFDSNVWISAIASRGLCLELLQIVLGDEGTTFTLVTCTQVEQEVLRALGGKFRMASDDLRRAQRLLRVAEFFEPPSWNAPAGFPDPDDTPLVAAALAAGAERFVTGDRALLALGAVEGLRPVDPRAAYIELRGLG